MSRRTEPTVEPLDLPREYGSVSERLSWSSVEHRLEAAPIYWLGTVRPDGRPHAVPVDGLWGVASTVVPSQDASRFVFESPENDLTRPGAG